MFCGHLPRVGPRRRGQEVWGRTGGVPSKVQETWQREPDTGPVGKGNPGRGGPASYGSQQIYGITEFLSEEVEWGLSAEGRQARSG